MIADILDAARHLAAYLRGGEVGPAAGGDRRRIGEHLGRT